MWYFISNNMNLAAFLMGALAVLTDLLDGYMARKLNQISEWGKVIDPVADKVFVGTTAVCLVLRGSVPLWFVLAVLARDGLILLGGLYASTKIKMVIPSNYVGKAAVLVITAVMAFAIFDVTNIVNILVYVATGALILSLAVYAKGMVDRLKKAKGN